MIDEHYPYDKIFDQPHEGLLQQELVTYKLINDQVIRTTVVRQFFTDDYIDSTTTCYIGQK